MYRFISWLISNPSRAKFFCKHCNLKFYRDENSQDESLESLLVSMRADSRCELTVSHPQWVLKCLEGYKSSVVKEGLEEEEHYVDRMIDDLTADDGEPSQFGSCSSHEDVPKAKLNAESQDSFCSAVTLDSMVASDESVSNDRKERPKSASKKNNGLDPYIRMLNQMANNSKGSVDDNSVSTSSSDGYSSQFDSSITGSKDEAYKLAAKSPKSPFRNKVVLSLSSTDEAEPQPHRSTGKAKGHRKVKSFHGITSLSRRSEVEYISSQDDFNEPAEIDTRNTSYAEQATRSAINNSGLFLNSTPITNFSVSYDDGELDIQRKTQFKAMGSIPRVGGRTEALPKVPLHSKAPVSAAPVDNSDDRSTNSAAVNFSQIYQDDSSAGSVDKKVKVVNPSSAPGAEDFDDNSTIESSLASVSSESLVIPSTSALSTKSKSVLNVYEDKENSSSNVQNRLPQSLSLLDQPYYSKPHSVSPKKQTKNLERQKSFREEVEQTIVKKDVTLFNMRMQLEAENKYFSATMRSADSATKSIEQSIQLMNSRDSDAALTELLLTDSADYASFKIPPQSTELLNAMETQLSTIEAAVQRDMRNNGIISAGSGNGSSGKGKDKSEYLKALASTLRQRIASQRERLKMAAYYKAVLQERHKGLNDLTSNCKSLGQEVLTASKKSKAPEPVE